MMHPMLLGICSFACNVCALQILQNRETWLGICFFLFETERVKTAMTLDPKASNLKSQEKGVYHASDVVHCGSG
jgi:hypothetical protein